MKKTLSTEEAFHKVYETLYKSLDHTTQATIKFYENEYKMYESLIVNHLEDEPPKFFKKLHKKWEDKLAELNNEHDKAFENYIEECEELYKLHTL